MDNGGATRILPTAMHYRHAFHAGNFADVFKHVVLVGLLTALSKKDKPWAYIDTHAGAGAYRLDGTTVGLADEWRQGVTLLDHGAEALPLPSMIDGYLAALRNCGFDWAAGRTCYPGSPLLARALARPGMGDRLILCEKVETVVEELRLNMRGSAVATQIHHRNGYEAWSLLPPPEKRGLLLIDPPFEQPGEFDAIVALAAQASSRFANAIQAIWYPLKDERTTSQFVRRVVRETGKPGIDLRIETDGPARSIDANGITKRRMTACGMLVVNPPYGFEGAASGAMPWLSQRLARGSGANWSMQLASN